MEKYQRLISSVIIGISIIIAAVIISNAIIYAGNAVGNLSAAISMIGK